MNIYHMFFIHLSIDGHLGCFCFFGIVNNVAINVGVCTYCQISDFVSILNSRSDIYRCSHPNLSSHQSVLKLSGVQGLSCEGYNCSQQAARRPVVNHRSMEVGVFSGFYASVVGNFSSDYFFCIVLLDPSDSLCRATC